MTMIDHTVCPGSAQGFPDRVIPALKTPHLHSQLRILGYE